VVSTLAITEITSEGQMLVLMSQREIGARRGLIVSGDGPTGKTTSIKQLGRAVARRNRRGWGRPVTVACLGMPWKEPSRSTTSFY